MLFLIHCFIKNTRNMSNMVEKFVQYLYNNHVINLRGMTK